MNEINIIMPYKDHGKWMFDDASVGLYRELFVGGADDIMDEIARRLSKFNTRPPARFLLTFSRHPFPDHQFQFRRKSYNKKRDTVGHSYKCTALNMEGWLCPALLKYFDTAPANLYVRAEAAPPGMRSLSQWREADETTTVHDYMLVDFDDAQRIGVRVRGIRTWSRAQEKWFVIDLPALPQ